MYKKNIKRVFTAYYYFMNEKVMFKKKYLKAKNPCIFLLTVLFIAVLFFTSCGEFRSFDGPEQPDLGSINKIKIYLSEEDKNKLYNSLFDHDYAHCTYRENSHVYDGWIKIRGDVSRAYPKKSFTLKFIHANEEKKYSLDASFKDPSQARNCLAFEAYRYMGLPVPKTEAAALFINDVYIGCYTKIELYTADMLDPVFGTCEMFKCKFKDMGNDLPVYYLSEKKIIEDNDFSSLSRLISYADNMPDVQWLDFVNNNFHIELTAKYLFVHGYLSVTDTSKKNFNVVYNGKYALLPWDHEANMRRNYNGNAVLSSNDSFTGDNMLISRLLMEGSPIRAAYIEIFKDEITNHVNPDPLVEKLLEEKDEIYNSIRDAVKYDNNRYYNADLFEDDMRPGGLIEAFFSEREGEIPSWLKP